jgi:hypothetical protein
MRIPCFLLVAALVPSTAIAQEVPDHDAQLASAVLAAPEPLREGARVLGWTASGASVELRAGSNEMVCIADRPGDEDYSVACYHVSVDPYMARGRELSAQGVEGRERNAIRWREMEEGTLPLPEPSAALYILHGSGFDAEAGEVANRFLRYVLYMPGATPEAVGLPTRPTEPGMPWLMFAGTPGAHVMITPPVPDQP